MKLGDIVIVHGKLDSRIRDNAENGLVYGTLSSFLNGENAEVEVILENMDLWVGLKREISPKD